MSNEQTTKVHPNLNEKLDNTDSSNGGLVYSENKEVARLSTGEICKILSLPNSDVTMDDVEVMKKKPRMPKYNQSAKTIQSFQSNVEKSRTSRQVDETPVKSPGLMPNSTKASQNRMVNIKNNQGGGAANPNESRNAAPVEGAGSGLHKSYNGNIRHGGGLQPTGYKGSMMPMINSGKGLPGDPNAGGQQTNAANLQAHPKSSGFRSNRNSHHDPALNPQQNYDGSQKW